jgi:hypothetical protein
MKGREGEGRGGEGRGGERRGKRGKEKGGEAGELAPKHKNLTPPIPAVVNDAESPVCNGQ